ncbi:PH domain-containing protein [Catenulispora subtropica]
MSSNMRFRLKLSPRGWVSSAVFAASPVIIPGLVSLTKPRPVHYNGLGYGLFAVAAALIVLRQIRAATVLEAGGIRMHRTFSSRYLPWNEITGVEVIARAKVRLVHVRTSSGQLVRLPAPIAGGSFEDTQFDAQVAEITAAWSAATA